MRILHRTRKFGMSDEARASRTGFIGGSDARIIMGGDQMAIEALWRQKRGEQEMDDLSNVLIVQMGNVTEALNTDWFEMQTGMYVTDEQQVVNYAEWEIARSTLDGKVRETLEGEPLGVFEAKWMMPFNWTIEKAVEKYFAQVQHNMMVTGLQKSFLSVITGAGQWAYLPVEADYFYQVALLEAERDFWDCVQTGRTPGVPMVETPQISHDEMRIVDMSESNEWGDLAATLTENADAVSKYEKAEKDIKKLMPDDAKEAFGNGVKITRSKDNKLRLTLPKEKKAAAKKAA